jgi:hypothetical protein
MEESLEMFKKEKETAIERNYFTLIKRNKRKSKSRHQYIATETFN